MKKRRLKVVLQVVLLLVATLGSVKYISDKMKLEILQKKREEVKKYANIISAGGDHVLWLKEDGTVKATGDNENGQCNVGTWKDIISISAGGLVSAGLRSDGTVVAVGNNDKNQCDVSEWKDIVAIEAGSYFTVGLKKDGTLVTTGRDYADEEIDLSDWDLF